MSGPAITIQTAVVTGASRGFGRGIATTLSSEGATVIGVARNALQLDNLHDELGAGFTGVVGDVCDPDLARSLILEHRPEIIVLNAGAAPVTGPLQEQSWRSFSRNWEVDTQHVFNWTKEALRAPLAPGSIVIAMSSGAAVGGSPLSGGYAGAKAAIRFISAYAALESERAQMGIRFTALLPQLTPATDLGAAGAAAYAEREGVDVRTFLQRFDPILTPELVGKAVVDICRAGEQEGGERPGAYMLSGTGLRGIS
jgi:NAD(P)-dependent dehydrogenase (short-subunit alcohol dehydrogenase family)